MPKMVLPPGEFKRIIRQRRRNRGADRYDEVWNGVYVMSPLADNEHQELGFELASTFREVVGADKAIRIFPGCNVSDRADDWTKNYRCPDVAVFLAGNPAEDRGSHWLGGPDFAVEVISPHDRSRKKFGFYATVKVRELLFLARRPWALELYRRNGQSWDPIGKSTVNEPATLTSDVLPMTLRLLPGEPRPQIEVARADGSQKWLI